MKLKQYLQQHKLSQNEFSKVIGVNQNTISNYIAGRRTPKNYIQERILEATGGLVSFRDWIPAIKGRTYYQEIFKKYKISISEISKILMIDDFELLEFLESDSFDKYQRLKLNDFCEKLEFAEWYKEVILFLKSKKIEGFGQKQIANELGLSVASVSLHIKNNTFSSKQIAIIKGYYKGLLKHKKGK